MLKTVHTILFLGIENVSNTRRRRPGLISVTLSGLNILGI